MPSVQIYIREENWEAWQAITNKSKEVNQWLTTRKSLVTTAADSASPTKPRGTVLKPPSIDIDGKNLPDQKVLDKLTNEYFAGPLFRNKKKGKL